MSKCFTFKNGNKNIKLKGITKIIKQAFYPDYVYTRDKYSVSTGAGSSTEGRSRGSLIHRQLRDFFNESHEKFKVKHEGVHDYTKKAIIAMKSWNMTPIKAEVPICDPKQKIGTGIDAVCLRDSKLCFLEFKSGGDGYFEKGSGNMKGILELLSNCPKNQAFIQLIVENEITRRNYGVSADELHVIQLCSSGVNPYYVPSFLLDMAPQIYDEVIKNLNESKKSKKVKTKKVKK